MNKIISKTFEIVSAVLPPKNNFIEEEIKKQGITPLRWAIVDVQNNTLTISASGEEI